ncbi:MAG TPA: Ni/Fe hydrogenase subunit gamma [Gammaproteobacteria bacterium]|nr:Ni/Fe hydrogenase subunit gamma [Gammaproteobacteria bacterium]
MASPRHPHEAEIIERVAESPDIFTLRLRFTDPAVQRHYHFRPGQFNMVYLYGVGEVPISIVSDPKNEDLYDHTIRAVGRVTKGLAALETGARVGIRGPYGRGWPLRLVEGRDVMIVTGGLGCAPTVSVINYILERRERYGRLYIMQGVKHARDLLWHERYEQWATEPNVEVIIAADQGGALWPWRVGRVTDAFDELRLQANRTVAMMCGPEGMMIAAARALLEKGLDELAIFLSMERNMQCAVGHCGHCQHGGQFVCKDGPVFAYPEVKALLGVRGF